LSEPQKADKKLLEEAARDLLGKYATRKIAIKAGAEKGRKSEGHRDHEFEGDGIECSELRAGF
jgi:hypothetical protein